MKDLLIICIITAVLSTLFYVLVATVQLNDFQILMTIAGSMVVMTAISILKGLKDDLR